MDSELKSSISTNSGKKVLALIPLNLDGHLFDSDYNGGKASKVRSHLTAYFTGREHDTAMFEREIE